MNSRARDRGATQPENHFERLVGLLPDTNYFAKDVQGRFVEADAGFVEMLGCTSRDEILGRTDFDFFPNYMAEQFVRDDQRVMKTGEPMVNHLELIPDGDITFSGWAVTKVPMRNGRNDVIGIAGFASRLAPDRTPFSQGRELFRVLEHIGKNYSGELSVTELAKMAGFSIRAFERNFAASFGISPLKYVNRVRLQAVRHLLLRTRRSLSSIASDCGFCDQSHMTAMFRKHFGISPRRYRLTRSVPRS